MNKKNAEDEVKKNLKIILVGAPNSGKTSILKRLITNTFHQQTTPTQKIDIGVKLINLNKQIFTVEIWDIPALATMEEIMSDTYMEDLDGVMLVIDSTEISSLQYISKWTNKFQEYAMQRDHNVLISKSRNETSRFQSNQGTEGLKGNLPYGFPIILLSNKKDSELSNMSESMIRDRSAVSKLNGAFLVSAKDFSDPSISRSFITLVSLIIKSQSMGGLGLTGNMPIGHNNESQYNQNFQIKVHNEHSQSDKQKNNKNINNNSTDPLANDNNNNNKISDLEARIAEIADRHKNEFTADEEEDQAT